MAYARLSADAKEVIITRSSSVRTTVKLESGETKSFWKTESKQIARVCINEPISAIEELTFDESKSIQTWLDRQLSEIDDAFIRNAEKGFFGGTPVIRRSSKDYEVWANHKDLIDNRKTGEFLGIISGAHKTTRTKAYVKKNKASKKYEEEENSFDRLQRLIQEDKLEELLNPTIYAILIFISKSERRPSDAFSTEQLSRIYASYRVLYKVINALEKEGKLKVIGEKLSLKQLDKIKESGATGYLIGKQKPVPILLQEYAANRPSIVGNGQSAANEHPD